MDTVGDSTFTPDYRHVAALMRNERPLRLPLYEHLVGLEYLPPMQVDDPDLYADLFRRIGDFMLAVWREFLVRYGRHFAACRFGDDLGFKSSLLTNPSTVRDHVLPQYRRIVGAIHAAGRPFLWHSCGRERPTLPRHRARLRAGLGQLHSRLRPRRELPRHDPRRPAYPRT